MANSDEKPVKLLVVDSSALIRRAPLKDLTDTVYCVDGVIGEIKDASTRESLNVLPFEFKLKQASSDAVKFISNFSRKTGDYSNLSAVDLHLLALTYQLCKENLNEEEFKQLKLEPVKNLAPVEQTKLKLDKPVNIAGFYVPKKENNAEEKKLEELVEDIKLSDESNKKDDEESKEEKDEEQNEEKENENENESENENETSKDDNNNENNENGDDEEGWINPGNLEKIKKESKVDAEQEDLGSTKIKVACMTSDFAMQNVLIQIGIPVLSVDGLLIKKARSYVLKCRTCKKVTTNMEKVFCPLCGYKTLQRVIVIVDSDGNKVYKERRKPLTTKGLRFSLPTPHGGKHPTYPILMEDQPRAHNFPAKKSRVKNNPLDPDYVYQASPFTTRDVQSKASRLGIKSDTTDRFNKRH